MHLPRAEGSIALHSGLLASVLAIVAGCTNGGQQQAAKLDEEASSKPPQVYCANVPVERSFCKALEIDVPAGRLRLAVADTDDAREQGLMGVAAVPANEGMIFVFPDGANRERNFWMKDTIVPLDMIFVSMNGVVTAVDANVPASRTGASPASIAHRDGVARYVIELRSGGAQAARIAPGVRLEIPPLASS